MTPQQIQNVRDWIAALRSGTYKQGYSRLLSTSGTYCCLGVLCEINNVAKKELNKSLSNEMYYVFNIAHNGRDAHEIIRNDVLPTIFYEQVTGWRNWSFRIPSTYHDYIKSKLVHLGQSIDITTINDIVKLSFNDIADIIEYNLETYLLESTNHD